MRIQLGLSMLLLSGGLVFAQSVAQEADGVYQLRYFSNLNVADSVINVTNSGVVSGFDPAGRICISVYTFDPAQEMISCCSCLVTPDGLQTISARNDLVSNTLTPSSPASITVKLLSSLPVGGTCDASTPAANNLARGMKAWGSTVRALPGNPVTYGVAETEFAKSELSASELMKLTRFCGFIQAVGSGFGICKSCQTGELGAVRK